MYGYYYFGSSVGSGEYKQAKIIKNENEQYTNVNVKKVSVT